MGVTLRNLTAAVMALAVCAATVATTAPVAAVALDPPQTVTPDSWEETMHQRRVAAIAILVKPADVITLAGLPRPWTSLDYEKLIDRFGIAFEDRPAAADEEFDRYIEAWRRVDAHTLDVLLANSVGRHFFGSAMPWDERATCRAAAASMRAAAHRVLEALASAATDQVAAQEEARIIRRDLDRQILRAELGSWLRGQTTDVAAIVEATPLSIKLRQQARAAIDSLQPSVDRHLKKIREIRERHERAWVARLWPVPAADAPEETRQAFWHDLQAAAQTGLAEAFVTAGELCELNFAALERLEPILPRQMWRQIRSRVLADTLLSSSTLEHGVDPFPGQRRRADQLHGEERDRRLAVIDSLDRTFQREEALLQKEMVAACTVFLDEQSGLQGRRLEEEGKALAEIDSRIHALYAKARADLGIDGTTARPWPAPSALHTRSIHNSGEPGLGQQDRRNNFARMVSVCQPLSETEFAHLAQLAGGGDNAKTFCENARRESQELVVKIEREETAAREARGRTGAPPSREGDSSGAVARLVQSRASTKELETIESALFAALIATAPESAKERLRAEERLRSFRRLADLLGSSNGSCDIGELGWSNLHLVDLLAVVRNAGLSEQAMRDLSPLLDTYSIEAFASLELRRDALPIALREMWTAGAAARAATDATPDEQRALQQRASQLSRAARHCERSLDDVNLKWMPALLGAISARADRDRLQMAIWHAWWPTVYENSELALRAIAAARSRPGLSQEALSALQTIDESVRVRLTPIDAECAGILEFGFDRRGPTSLAAGPGEDVRNRTLDRRGWDRAEVAASALRAIERTLPDEWPDLRATLVPEHLHRHQRAFDR